MNPIQKALDEVKWNIPRLVLDLVFRPVKPGGWNRQPISTDERIMQSVVRPRVMVDCNLLGGSEQTISLEGLLQERNNDFTSVYRIPKDRTGGRSIISALNITFTDPTRLSNIGTTNTQDSSMMMRVGQAVMDAHGAIPMISTHRVQLIGENVVMVRDNVFIPGYAFLKCIIENDENMGHLQLKSYHKFAKLVLLAVQGYIYTNYRVELAEGKLSGGAELGVIKEIVDEYKDSNELYDTYLREKWAKIAFMNDNETYPRHVRRLVGGTR